MMTRSLFSILFCLSLLADRSFSQEQGAEIVSFPQSPYVLYHFVRSTAHVRKTADELDRKNGSGNSLRHAFSSTIGLTDSDAAIIFDLALTLDQQFVSLDSQASKLIADTKSGASKGPLPPPPSALATLQQQKTALMNALSAVVRQRLSVAGGNTLAVYFQRHSIQDQNSVTAVNSAQP